MMNKIAMMSQLLGVVVAAGCGEGSTPPTSVEHADSLRQSVVLACPAGVRTESIKWEHSMLIKDVSVVNDSCRTVFNAPISATCTAAMRGAWSFGRLITEAAGDNSPSELALRLLESYEETQMVGATPLIGRTKIRAWIDRWRVDSGCTAGKKVDDPDGACTLDFAKAPFRLLGIVNRIDLRSGNGAIGCSYSGCPLPGPVADVGEGRIVFGLTNGDGSPTFATMIFEYRLPTSTSLSPLMWAQAWQSLSSLSLPSSNYNASLQGLTDAFTKRGALPSGPNRGSALQRIRSNEFVWDARPADDKQWELRELPFRCLTAGCDINKQFLLPSPVAMTPDLRFNLDVAFQPTLMKFMDQNAAAIVASTHTVPAMFDGVAFQAGSALSKRNGSGQEVKWGNGFALTPPPAIDAGDVRRNFGVLTCNGCHYSETSTNNFHLAPRNATQASMSSPFLNPSAPLVIMDPVTGDPVEFDEPGRRKCEMAWLLAGNANTLSTATGRVH